MQYGRSFPTITLQENYDRKNWLIRAEDENTPISTEVEWKLTQENTMEDDTNKGMG